MDDDIHYLIPAAEVERIETERYQQLAALPRRGFTDAPALTAPVPES
jgi:hypothetical protein